MNNWEKIPIKTHGWCNFSKFWIYYKDFFNDSIYGTYSYTQKLFNKIIGEYYNLEYPFFEMEITDMAFDKKIRKILNK